MKTKSKHEAPFEHHGGSLNVESGSEAVVFAERVFWRGPYEFIPDAHAAGIAVLHQVGSVDAAVRAKQAGVDVIIAQGLRPAEMRLVKEVILLVYCKKATYHKSLMGVST